MDPLHRTIDNRSIEDLTLELHDEDRAAPIRLIDTRTGASIRLTLAGARNLRWALADILIRMAQDPVDPHAEAGGRTPQADLFRSAA